MNLQCEQNHTTTIWATEFEATHSIHMPWIQTLAEAQGIMTVPIETYLSRWLPMIGARNPLHTQYALGSCSSAVCTGTAQFSNMSISWPKVLSLSLTLATYRSSPLFGNSISIEDIDGSCVTYELVGRALYDDKRKHFTSQLRCSGKVFTYDDILPLSQSSSMSALPVLKAHGSQSLLQELGPFEAPLFVYVRTSAKITVGQLAIQSSRFIN